MTDKKLVPITGRHTTFHSLASEAMVNEKARGGIIIWFDEEGTMSYGTVNVRMSDVGMALMAVQKMAVDQMENG